MTGNAFYEPLYVSFFSAKTVKSKWRNKMVLEKSMYDEWVTKFFGDELRYESGEIK